VAACHFPVEVGEKLSQKRAAIAQPDREAVADLSASLLDEAIRPADKP